MGIIFHNERLSPELRKKLIASCPFSAIAEETDGTLSVSSGCRLCRLCVKTGEGAVEIEETSSQTVDKHKWTGITVFADISNDYIHPVVFELAGKAMELTSSCPQKITILVLGSQTEENIRKLQECGADYLYIYDSIELNDFRIDSYTDVISQFIEKHKPSAILFGATEKGRMLAPRIAARFRTGLTADCTALEMNPDSDIVQIRPAFGGNIMAEILTTRTRPQLCTARYKIFNAARNISKKADIIKLNASVSESCMTIIKAEKKPPVNDISDATVIVAIGRGVRSKDDLPMIEELASLLSAEIAFSRPMIEAGWAEPTRQIGLSGRTVKPKLIIAIGISGAIQFTAGMKESDFIIAVNTDRNAPIISFADCSIIGNLYEIIPALIMKIKGNKS